MAATRKILAFDLGAESGRGVLGLFDGSRLELQDVHRFPNTPAATLDTLHWDVLNLYSEMLAGLRKAASQFGGVEVNEYTDASTSQMLDPMKRNWDFDLLGRFGLLPKMFGSIVLPGTVLGPLRARICSDTGVSPVPVVLPATHDTGAAVAAVP